MRLIACLALLCATVAAQNRRIPFQKGVNFTAESHAGYSPETARPMLEQLRKYGVNSIAIVPYGFTRKGSPTVRFSGSGSMERDDDIQESTKVAHELGIRVFLKPQVWVRPGYPGDLEFPSAADRKAWFQQYTVFISHYAVLAQTIHADMFCVGVEFIKLSGYEAEWRKVIAQVRKLYSGPLVYAANFGPEFEQLKFWDALDYIGLNNYYPLPDDLNNSAVVATVEAVQKRFRRPVIFPEAGFSTYDAPHRQPWDETPRKLAPEQQAKCYDAVLRAFYNKPWFQGVYWWKVGTNGFGGTQDGSHTPWRKPAMDVIARWYKLR
jgi:hypothetical protein